MKVYLAGKIAKNDWRHSIVDGLRSAVHIGSASHWPVLQSAIFDEHDYVGPFFTSCDHGCFHGPGSHGVGVGGPSGGCCVNPISPHAVASLCLGAVSNCDLFFAWFDEDCGSAYGTLLELGWALAMEKLVVIGVHRKADTSDLWFALRASEALRSIRCNPVIEANTAREALAVYLATVGQLGLVESRVPELSLLNR